MSISRDWCGQQGRRVTLNVTGRLKSVAEKKEKMELQLMTRKGRFVDVGHADTFKDIYVYEK
jgi:hypothetical protein